MLEDKSACDVIELNDSLIVQLTVNAVTMRSVVTLKPRFRVIRDNFQIGSLNGAGHIYMQMFVDICLKIDHYKLLVTNTPIVKCP